MASAPSTAASRVRLADWSRPAAAFAVNGVLYGSLLTRYPEIADRVGADESEFGAALFAAAMGGLLGSLTAPALTRVVRESSATLVAGADTPCSPSPSSGRPTCSCWQPRCCWPTCSTARTT
ncbi:hypothetical protein ACFQZ4_05765 [Catellatospora coxensis]